MFSRKIGLDLGTVNTLVFHLKKGIIVNEPTIVALSTQDNQVLAVGREAQKMVGRAPEDIVINKPLKRGVIADYQAAKGLISYFMDKAVADFPFLNLEAVVSVPAGITSAEKRALVKAAQQAGAQKIFLVKEPILAALGAGLAINEPSGHLVVNIGGGIAEIAAISLGGMVSVKTVRLGGNDFDEKVVDYVKKQYNLAIGEKTAEEIKITIGAALPKEEDEILEIRGRDEIDGLPKNIEITSSEITNIFKPLVYEIVKGIKEVFHDTPPELSADIMNQGIVLTGGGALLSGLDEFITQALGVPCFVAEEALFCVVKGTGLVLKNLSVYKRSIVAY